MFLLDGSAECNKSHPHEKTRKGGLAKYLELALRYFRTEAKDSYDRYANVKTSNLVEHFDDPGDQSLTSRVRFRIDVDKDD